jgi:hypothetical protein
MADRTEDLFDLGDVAPAVVAQMARVSGIPYDFSHVLL